MDNLTDSVTSLFSVNFVLLPSKSAREEFDGIDKPTLENLFKQFKEVRNLQASFRDPGSNLVHIINKLYVKFRDIGAFENIDQNKAVSKKELFDTVSRFASKSEYFDEKCLDTPWYDEWKSKFFQVLEQCEHEFAGANFGSIFVLTTDDLDNPKDVISDLLVRVKSVSKLPWFSPNFLKYFLVVHVRRKKSNQELSQDKLDSFNEVLSSYGSGQCYLLQMEEAAFTRTEIRSEVREKEPTEIVTNVELINGDGIDPLGSPTNPDKIFDSRQDEFDVSLPEATIEFILDQILVTSIEGMLKEFLVKAVIPWSERQLRLLNESVSLKKGVRKSIFNATKQLFAMSSSTVNMKSPGAPGPIYTLESSEMQQRKIADLFMCLTLYELAHSAYYTAKKEFQIDGASLYFAGASEALGVASVLINKFQKHYFEEAIVTYVEVCKNQDLGTRATLLATDALLAMGPNDAANLFIRMTSEDSDLRSALFLEQAAKCFLTSPTPRTRKAAFHYVLAGHRYNKCGLKRHALACYSKFASPHWTHAIDHVNATVLRLQQQLQVNNVSNRSSETKNDGVSQNGISSIESVQQTTEP
ncbi:Trafficking protein particle complex subunit 8 [Halotydeus destructor]|nr:Trafficking protein particle complex subunit 8 [Halotydeus destructor]